MNYRFSKLTKKFYPSVFFCTAKGRGLGVMKTHGSLYQILHKKKHPKAGMYKYIMSMLEPLGTKCLSANCKCLAYKCQLLKHYVKSYLLVLFRLQGSINWRPTVEITPLSTIPGGIIDRYLGNINIFCIRESTSVREVSYELWNIFANRVHIRL